MQITQALEFLAGHSQAVLATRRTDGRPQLSPVNAGLVDGQVVVSSRSSLAKVRNLRRDPRVSILVMSDAFYGRWVQLDGTADVVELPEAMELLVAVYLAVKGEHPDWADYRAAMVRDDRVAIRITPLRATGGG